MSAAAVAPGCSGAGRGGRAVALREPPGAVAGTPAAAAIHATISAPGGIWPLALTMPSMASAGVIITP